MQNGIVGRRHPSAASIFFDHVVLRGHLVRLLYFCSIGHPFRWTGRNTLPTILEAVDDLFFLHGALKALGPKRVKKCERRTFVSVPSIEQLSIIAEYHGKRLCLCISVFFYNHSHPPIFFLHCHGPTAFGGSVGG